VLTGEDIVKLQEAVLQMKTPDHIFELAVKWVRATRPDTQEGSQPSSKGREAPEWVNRYVRWGAGPRAMQYLLLAAKARALIQGRPMPIEEDLKNLFLSAMGHRIHMNYHAEAENVRTSQLMEQVLRSL
jgi:MoxR-like ATPase